MSHSTLQLREDYKIQITKWENVLNHRNPANDANLNQELLENIRSFGQVLEKRIQDKIKSLEIDLDQYAVKGEYQRSIREGFDDLERIMRTYQTLLDITEIQDEQKSLLHKIKQHYIHYVVPLFNIIYKLENDYMAITTQAIIDKRKQMANIDIKMDILNNEKIQIKKRLLGLNRKKDYIEILKQIKKLERQRKMIYLAILHDHLNLYYFNHDRPSILTPLKQKTDDFREQLPIFEKDNIEKDNIERSLQIFKINELLKNYEESLIEYEKLKKQHKNQALNTALVWPQYEKKIQEEFSIEAKTN